MYNQLYFVATALFIVSVIAYAFVSHLLSRDIAAGVFPVRYDEEPTKS